MSRNETMAALPYQEPGPVPILTLTSFLLLLNLANYVINHLFYVGLLGQVFLGIAWGTPGLRWLEPSTEAVCVNLGYLGLLLLVYEGGLNTSFQSLIANFWLSLSIATTGIILPIALSFILVVLADATPLQAFSAGAALCSTSLGTTFAVMQSSGLNSTKMGVALTVAAMMDDVVGLVMVQVISKLGPESGKFSALTIVRPVLVSIALAVSVFVTCRFFIPPITIWLNKHRFQYPASFLSKMLWLEHLAFILHTVFLVGMIAGATYAETSNLFAAYLTGTAISWWDSEVPHSCTVPKTSDCNIHEKASLGKDVASPAPTATIGSLGDQIESSKPLETQSTSDRTQQQSGSHRTRKTGLAVFETYYDQPLQRVLKPFFFASIGFAIPIRSMFATNVLWRGIVYTLLMIVSKLACGFWLIRVTTPTWLHQILSKMPNGGGTRLQPPPVRSEAFSKGRVDGPAQQAEASSRQYATNDPLPHATRPMKPISIYPGAIIGCAMVARGEVGFLISSLAQAGGIFGGDPNGPLFLIVAWAIVLCTIVGPLLVGIILRRLRKISTKKTDDRDVRHDALGIWGVSEPSIRQDKVQDTFGGAQPQAWRSK